MTTVATRGVSFSRQLVHIVLQALGYGRKKGSNFMHGHLPLKSQVQISWNEAIGLKHGEVALFFQSINRPSDEMVEAKVGSRGAENTFYVQ